MIVYYTTMSLPRYLLIGGAPKAGTTSLYHYFAQHPDVCVSSRKETYFFARDFDYRGVCQLAQTRTAFDAYFAHARDKSQLRLEATPYTLYAANAAQAIDATLPNSTMLFVLRDPIRRLLSAYRMQKQRGATYVERFTFSQYVDALLKEDYSTNSIRQGAYVVYLTPFIKQFGRERVDVIFFEALAQRPLETIRGLCNRYGIDPTYFDNYTFTTHNQSHTPRFGWLNRLSLVAEPHIARLRQQIIRYPALHRAFESSVRAGKLGLRRFNSKADQNGSPRQETLLTPELQERLAQFYRPYNEQLAALLGEPLPW